MAKLQKIFALSIAVTAIVSSGYGESFTWTDSSGTSHFTDDPSKVPRKYRIKQESTGGSVSVVPPVEKLHKSYSVDLNQYDKRKQELEYNKRLLESLKSSVASKREALLAKRLRSNPETEVQVVRAIREHRADLLEIEKIEAQIVEIEKKIHQLE